MPAHGTRRKTVDNAKPKVDAAQIRVAPQITEILRQDKGAVVFGVNKGTVVDGISVYVVVGQTIEHAPASAGVKFVDKRGTLRA